MLCKESIDGLPVENYVQYKQNNDNNTRPEVNISPYSATHTQECYAAANNLIKQRSRAAHYCHRDKHQYIDNNICLQSIHCNKTFNVRGTRG